MDRRKTIRLVFYAAEACCCYLLQTLPLLPFERGGLLTAAALTVGVFENERTAVLTGALFGALADCACGCTGFFGIAISADCFIVSYLYRDRIRTSVITVLAVAGTAAVVIYAAHYMIFRIIAGFPEPEVCLEREYLPLLGGTAVFIPVFFLLNGGLHHRLSGKNKGAGSF